jgi:hypothetical protein
MLSEHSSERLRFLIRKGGKNADLIGKESLGIYTVIYKNYIKMSEGMGQPGELFLTATKKV